MKWHIANISMKRVKIPKAFKKYTYPADFKKLAEKFDPSYSALYCIPSIYFLVSDAEIIYIGTSGCVLWRIKQHRDKIFDSVIILQGDGWKDEEEYIRIFLPDFNKIIKIGIYNPFYYLFRND